MKFFCIICLFFHHHFELLEMFVHPSNTGECVLENTQTLFTPTNIVRAVFLSSTRINVFVREYINSQGSDPCVADKCSSPFCSADAKVLNSLGANPKFSCSFIIFQTWTRTFSLKIICLSYKIITFFLFWMFFFQSQ